MQWELVIALVLIIPVVLLPVALVWYLNVRGLYLAIEETNKKHEKVLAAEKTR